MAEDDPLVAFATFADTLRPQMINQGMPAQAIMPGDPDEVWLKYINQLHGKEKHTLAEWRALIDEYRNQPAYPDA